ncbi:hypothetical protein Enr10x_20970 [Gimesia panareensis]|uniref:Uncharacterized protein n=1 Tax=Gimesia panareensis TaxID=2527978 RepID=A0A517Q5A4_9PLAN|nr:hypothetical protein [Gimesia panareensis]QDT26787.1 hypothetical protein Enr10x_20970 [Gimesia panareensis]
MSNLRIRPKKMNYETDPIRTIEIFKVPSIDTTIEIPDWPDGYIKIYTGTLLSNVKFELDDPMNNGQLVSYEETNITKKLCGSQFANERYTRLVIAERLLASWYILRDLVVLDEEE